MSEHEQASLYERLGGADGVASVVAELYERILEDPELAPFFAGVDTDAVQRHQRELVVTAVGGPSSYAGRTIRDAHRGYAIEPRHLDLLHAHFVEAMASAGVAPADSSVVSGLVHRLWHAQFWSV